MDLILKKEYILTKSSAFSFDSEFCFANTTEADFYTQYEYLINFLAEVAKKFLFLKMSLLFALSFCQ